MRNWVKNAAAAIVLALFTAATSASAQAPDPQARDLAQRLTRVEEVVNRQGFYRAAGPFPGSLEQGLTRRFTVTLRAGQEYRIVGVCESRCGDLDMRLADPNETRVIEDVLPDPVPVISVRPLVTGQHTIDVMMARCSGAAPCWFAFNVYAR